LFPLGIIGTKNKCGLFKYIMPASFPNFKTLGENL